VIHQDKPVMIPDFLLENLLQKEFGTHFTTLFNGEAVPDEVPGVNLPTVIGNALTTFQIIPALWEGQDVFVSVSPLRPCWLNF